MTDPGDTEYEDDGEELDDEDEDTDSEFLDEEPSGDLSDGGLLFDELPPEDEDDEDDCCHYGK